jgi:hypothetical protein
MLRYLLSGSGAKFMFGVLTIVGCVEFVVGRDFGCCKIWTIWRQAACFMSGLVHMINLNNQIQCFDHH